MKSSTRLWPLLLLIAAFATGARAQQPVQPTPHSLTYTENKGQWNPEARYLFKASGLDLWVTNNGIVYDLHKETGSPAEFSRSGHVVRMKFVDASDKATASAMVSSRAPGTTNYLFGNDRSAWVTGVRRYEQIRIDGLYKGINAVLYLDGGNPRYDLVVAPNADPSKIRIELQGADNVSIDRNSTLVYTTSHGEIRQAGLFAYQTQSDRKAGCALGAVECAFVKNTDGTISFKLGEYDRSRPLVIDPLIYSTYIGSADMETPYDLAVDAAGNTYITGMTSSSTYPTTAGAYNTTYQGGSRDIIVSKLNPTGDTLLYSTYIGGSGQDIAYGIALGIGGEAFVTGTTSSTNFPTTVGAYQATPATSGGNSFITKLNAAGTGLLFSTYVQSVAATDIATDTDGSSYITGSATSGFQATDGAYKTIFGGGTSDAFVLKLNGTGAARDWATLFGGRGVDRGTALTVDKSGVVYLTGTTGDAAGFPITAGAYQTTVAGGTDIFIAKLGTTGATLTYSTLVGGADYDFGADIAIDGAGAAYITGTTKSQNYPVSNNGFQTNHGGNDAAFSVGDAFVTKLNPAGSGLVYSTFIGGTTGDAAQSIFVDSKGYAYIAGYTGSSNFPTTTGAFQATTQDSGDAFYVKFNADGTALLYSTFLGGDGPDTATAIAVDIRGDIYVTGHTRSTDYPTTDEAYDTSAGDKKDIFVTRLPGVLVTAPNGGEIWCGGSTHLITWETSGIPSFDVYISSDSGRTYNLLAVGVNGTSYQWPVPPTQAAGTQYRIRVQESGTAFQDFGDTTFVINSPPQIAQHPGNTTQPAGGTATFTAGANSVPQASVQWQVSTNNGESWTDLPNDTNRTLRVRNLKPEQNGNLYRAVFTNSCTSVPTESAMLTVVTVTVAGPNGGEKFCSGTKQMITWGLSGFSGASNFNISYSSDGGTTWNSIANGVLGNSYEWSIPTSQSPSTRYRVRVTLTSGGVVDISDSNFTINGRANITRHPENVSAEMGANISFTSEASGLPEPTIQWQVSTNNGQSWTNLSGGTRTVNEGRVESRFTVGAITRADSGALYRTIYANDCGADTTESARLAVFSDNPTGVNDPTGVDASFSIRISPNPSAGRSELRIETLRAGDVRIVLSDMNGRLVREIFNGFLSAGENLLTLDAESLPNGAYNCTIFSNGRQKTVKMTLTR